MTPSIKFITIGLVGAVILGISYFAINRGTVAEQNVLPVPERLDRAERLAITETLVSLMHEHNPRVAIDQLRARSQQDPRVLRDCHPIVHAIGQAAFQKYNDFGQAMLYRDEFCNAGYIHGVIESQFTEGDFNTGLLAICQGQPEGIQAWECFHGIGHGLMYASQNDLPWALDTCDQLPTTGSAASCRNGVFMENFGSDDVDHPSNYRSAERPLFPCLDQPADRRGDCFLYAPAYYVAIHPGAYQQMLEICRSAPPADQDACAWGVGTQLAKDNIDQLSVAAAWCRQGTRTQYQACFKGIISHIHVHAVGDQAEALALCESLSLNDRNYCIRNIQRLDES